MKHLLAITLVSLLTTIGVSSCRVDRSDPLLADAGDTGSSDVVEDTADTTIEEDTTCPNLWEPVCGADGETYANSCEAELRGVYDYAIGECELICAWEDCGDMPPVAPCPDGTGPEIDCLASGDECEWFIGECPFACPDAWDPVCGADGYTYDNPCLAEESGVEVAYGGRCEAIACPADVCGEEPVADPCPDGSPRELVCEDWGWGCEWTDGGCGSDCPGFWDPVCGVDGQTYDNECELIAAGVALDYWGECATTICADGACGEPPMIEPCSDGTFPLMECVATAGDCVWEISPCSGGCPDTWNPVCGTDGITYENRCLAERDGATVAYNGECVTDECPEEFCGELPPMMPCPGGTERAIACVGNPDDDTCSWFIGDCPGCERDDECPLGEICEDGMCSLSTCPGMYDPVCGEDNVTYTNACTARAAHVPIAYAGECGL